MDRYDGKIRKCPENCRYKARGVPFCGFCMMKILGRDKETEDMQMMVEMDSGEEKRQVVLEVADPKDIRPLINAIPDGVVISIDMEGVTDDGQKT